MRYNLQRLSRGISETFVLVPADKASNNFLIVCKKYYVDTVLKGFATNNGTSPQTHTPCDTYIYPDKKQHKNK